MKIQNATARGTVACRQLDGGNTAVFVHSGTETQTNLAGTSKKLQALGLEFFSYIRLGRVILSVPVIFASQVILPDGSWGEYNITSAQAEISLSRMAQYHSGVRRNITCCRLRCHHSNPTQTKMKISAPVVQGRFSITGPCSGGGVRVYWSVVEGIL